MKLGEMLVRDGRIDETQLKEALDRQRRDGGRLGTVLVETGLIDLDTLTVYLGLELGIPIATGATLDRAKRSAVRLLTPEQAARARAVPIIVQDRQVIAAIDDPHDLVVLDELAKTTGYRIIPRVAPEIRIFYYLERYYGVPRPPRFRVFGDSPRGGSATATNLPAPPLPGLPPKSQAPVTAPTPAPVLRTTPPPPPPPPSPEQEALEIDAEDLLIELEADETDKAEQAPEVGDRGPRANDPHLDRAPTGDAFEPLALDDAVSAMEEAQQRGDVADAIMRFASGLFDVSALCVVRDGMAFGWKASGPMLDRERIETLLIPLDRPSMFQTSIEREGVYHDRPFPATLHKHLYRVMRCPQPDTATVAAVAIGKRVVNILYGHRSDRPPLAESDLDGLREVCRAATEAYVRLIAVAKKERPRKGS